MPANYQSKPPSRKVRVKRPTVRPNPDAVDRNRAARPAPGMAQYNTPAPGSWGYGQSQDSDGMSWSNPQKGTWRGRQGLAKGPKGGRTSFGSKTYSNKTQRT
jgi:hypothetical protein